MLWSQGELGFAEIEDLVGTLILIFAAAIGPAMGIWFFAKQGPLVIDPEAETLTYRRHVFGFDRLGLVRVGTATTLMPSVSSVESGVPGEAATVKVAVVASGDFMLSPDDQLPRRRAEKLADHLNAVLMEYYGRKGEPLGPRKEMLL
ncbi:MAG: hypothetical protein ACE37F_37055 [Nannocystaceae bacterium]|nr:hypothetical protein [bacterium]